MVAPNKTHSSKTAVVICRSIISLSQQHLLYDSSIRSTTSWSSLYVEEGLQMRRKRPRRNRSGQVRVSRTKACRADESWSIDFMSDQLLDGRRFRILTLVHNFSRECLAVQAGHRLAGDHVVASLEDVCRERGFPETIRVDNGPEFISRSLDWWAYWNGVKTRLQPAREWR
jgi:transposase InsO family protein